MQVALVEVPMHPLAQNKFRGAITNYKNRIHTFSKLTNTPYWEMGFQLPLKDRDFRDLAHLIDSGRIIYQRELARKIENLLNPNT